MNIEGGCYCGNIRFKSDGKPEASMQCHCRECQYITGGNPNVIMIMPIDSFKFTKGQPQEFKRNDIENAVTRLFCNNCGTAIGTKTPTRANSIILKVGTFDDPSIFDPKIAIFTCDKQKFHYIDNNVKSFNKRP
tara:strand:- start:88 stop:489 length:402 start_codon:yes stop_codon:yes gene_type:complete